MQLCIQELRGKKLEMVKVERVENGRQVRLCVCACVCACVCFRLCMCTHIRLCVLLCMRKKRGEFASMPVISRSRSLRKHQSGTRICAHVFTEKQFRD